MNLHDKGTNRLLQAIGIEPAGKPRHTPGPWTWRGTSGDAHHVFAGENYVARVYAGSDPAEEANARLIAAAPDLLAALEGLFEHCAMIHKVWGDGCNQQQANAAQEAARAAIARAKP